MEAPDSRNKTDLDCMGKVLLQLSPYRVDASSQLKSTLNTNEPECIICN